MKRPFKPYNGAKAIDDSQVAGINRLAKLLIVIDGKIVPHYKHFSLKQHSQTHHQFELILDHDTFGNYENHKLETSNKFLGNRLTVVIRYKDIEDSPERTFVGVITKVGYLQEHSSLGNIVLSGFSPTILLDGAPHTQSFGGDRSVNMSIIANKLIKEGLGDSKFDIRVDAKDASDIVYSTQYNETHYNYLARMASAYGEQFFYDGEVLHFGQLPPQNKPLNLVYGRNVNDISIELNAVHTKPQFYGYNSSDNAKLTSGQTPLKHRSDLAQTAYKNNDTIFKTKALQVAPIKANTDKDVVNAQESEAGQKGVEVFTVSGSTTIPFLYPGCVADLEMRKQDSNKTSYFTRIMITDVEHDIDTLGHYTGRFKAIASDTGYLPKPDFTTPIAQPQIATVVSNADPKGQGRVTVKFDWQLHDTTNFIRMMSPDAGGTDQVTQNRGYVAVPEVGDQVMVGFVHNHPDRPFLMGGMFHGKVGLGGGSNNSVKSIQTRSGHRIVFTEDESIIITDKSGNEIHLDTTGSNINITAPETMTFTAKNMNFNVTENMNTSVGQDQSNTIGNNQTNSVGKNIVTTAGVDYSLNATGNIQEFSNNKTEMIDENYTTRSSVSDVIAKKITASSSEEDILIQSAKTVFMNSGEKSNNH
ncbi:MULTISPECIES: type VI secretion system Vgr family protein [Empedobacter]|uniref:Vgr family protein n=2 Tax=Empedobacter TaxID=59734 RepID=A0A7H9DS94_9FLAO|nr:MULTISPECIES: phage baseplate assembly protein V [Empedobacter]MDH2208325.1 phage baseplate assembly protein V [Empedobacter sp. GD03644]QLL58004.1 Vgr family protein [Empedobacter falsenii]